MDYAVVFTSKKHLPIFENSKKNDAALHFENNRPKYDWVYVIEALVYNLLHKCFQSA